MFYYIQDNTVIAKSETKIKINKTIKEIEIDIIFDNPYFENGKIIEYKNSEEKINNLKVIQDKENNELLIELAKEKKELEWLWYLVEIKNYKIITTNTEKSILYEKNNKINQINRDFNKKLQDYNSSYPIEEVKKFESKRNLANDVLNWWSSIYITKRALSLNITDIEFATLIKNKADLEQDFIAETEIERDILINNL